MLALIMLAIAFTVQDPSMRHVPPTEPTIQSLGKAGLARFATFRSLIETLDRSSSKMTRQTLGLSRA